MIKRIISYALTASMVFGALPAAIAAAEDAEPEREKPLMSVVGKVIDGDDEFFEVSLEVNSQERELSAVSIVLQYDPQYLLPVTWDGADIDMTNADKWSSRMAMPTLCEHTWNASTALTYADSETGKNYLFMSAEYPGHADLVSEEEPAAGGEEGGGEPTATEEPAAPTDAPNTDTGMVVVARFKYANAAAKAAIEADWNDILASASDKTATANKFISLASDAVSKESPSYYPVGIYYKDGFEAYVGDVANYTGMPASENTGGNKFEIVLGHGKSALAGGLTLNDVTAVLFFDWDDSFLGALTLGRGQDGRKAVDEYVEDNLVHPDLRRAKDADGNRVNVEATNQSIARIDNYRGIYPAEGPSGSTVVTDGEKYPLTYKLDYVFYGKDDPQPTLEPEATPDPDALTDGADYPYTHGWATIDDPLKLSDTWSALSDGEEAPETYDFSNIDKSVIYVKALYKPGEWLNNGAKGNHYKVSSIEDFTYDRIAANTLADGTYAVRFQYFRINKNGYGVTRRKAPAVRMTMTLPSGDTTIMQINVQNTDIMDVELTPSRKVQSVKAELVETDGTDISNAGLVCDTEDAKSVINLTADNKTDFDGYAKKGTLYKLLYEGNKQAQSITPNDWAKLNNFDLQCMDLRQKTGVAYANAILANAAKNSILNLIKAARNANKDPMELTFYQIQWYIFKTQYEQDPDVAKANCLGQCTWLK